MLLRDEAYLDLCRTALNEAQERLIQEKDQVAQTRPPFGILATKKAREEFETSMQTVLNTEAGIAARLGKLEAIEKWLKTAIRDRLRLYLRQASENYRRSSKIAESIKSWDRLIEHYGEQLLALARNIKNVSVSFAGAAGGARSAFADRAQAFAELRMGADSLDRTAVQLESLSRTMAMYAANSPYKDVQLADLPIKGVVGWVDQLALQHDRDALPAAQEMEADARGVVAKKLIDFHSSAAAALDMIAAIEEKELENYWEVLRAHALAHYVQERDVDEVLAELNERYVVATIERRQRAIESQADPYGHER
ncbi:MAG TPA: hypothetical protein VKG78_08760 [Opitutaceae bacterium]|nr:hypothetical protein [Opitutaceae bacterium]